MTNVKPRLQKHTKIYEQLGNVFQNDGAMGAVDGVKDGSAAAKDPTNYLGIATGGVARVGAGGVSLTGKQMVRLLFVKSEKLYKMVLQVRLQKKLLRKQEWKQQREL